MGEHIDMKRITKYDHPSNFASLLFASTALIFFLLFFLLLTLRKDEFVHPKGHHVGPLKQTHKLTHTNTNTHSHKLASITYTHTNIQTNIHNSQTKIHKATHIEII